MNAAGGDTPLSRLGGLARLEAIVADFVDTMVSDMMIGFYFRDVDASRLKALETQFAARALGAELPYEGRPLRTAHAPHRIMGGHFDRRRTLLQRTLERHGVPADVQAIWLAHVDRLRTQITADGPGTCA